MKDILSRIIEDKMVAVARAKAGAEHFSKIPKRASGGGIFRQRLESANGLAIIAEIKKASPAKGILCSNFSPVTLASEYEASGADCLSVLTEEKYFLGLPEHLQAVRAAVPLPVLRKDFIIDPWQIEETVGMGADAMLLIVAVLGLNRTRDYLQQAKSLGLDIIVEIHNETEAEIAIQAGADIIGINNRNLRDFSVDLATTARLAADLPQNILVVSESGIFTAEDAAYVASAGAKAVLVGESLLRAHSIAAQMRALKGVLK